ncbi:heme exporter protein B [Sphingomonas vulcanisoli]|uniref:Heme exporter protein B n=1 Tax=Sphingomonas vulcanisoli TaxID=1658060 RepID=A0ABX0TSY6_9SPHN|nr:heme exporter protein CcmB [Sphingomonas vulcanisoli]NIJ08632.1 heme exporter protein B [Sphingomonas vulcanisoli]
MRAVLAIIRRDLVLTFGSGGGWLPILFYLLIAILMPFAIGPDQQLLGRVGGGIAWAAALLAALLPIERLIAPDLSSGVIDQLTVRGISREGIGAAKLIAHWLAFGPPLMLATLPAAALLGITPAILARLELGLLIGTPGLAALALATAALTAGLRGAGALAGLMMLPLAIPLLIFGAGALAQGAGALKLLAAASLLLVAGTPFVVGGALRFRD